MPRYNRAGRRGPIALAGAAAALTTLVAACSSTPTASTADASASGGGTGGAGSSQHFTVAYVPGVTLNPYFSTITRAMQDVAAQNNVTVDYQGPANFAAADQTKVLNAVFASRPDLLIISPVDPVGLRAAIQRFISAGIPVITTDAVLQDTSGIVSSIHGNSIQGGQLAGAQMAKLTGGSGTVAILNIAAGVPTLEDRVTGFTTGLKAAPNVRLAPVTQAGGDPSGSQTATRSLLLAYPDLKGIYGVTEVNAEGAAAALAAVGKKGAIPIVGYDGTPQEVKLLRDGSVQYLVVQQAKKEGQIAMQTAIDYLRGNKSGIKKEVTLDTVGVDMTNIDQPEIQDVLYGPAIN